MAKLFSFIEPCELILVLGVMLDKEEERREEGEMNG